MKRSISLSVCHKELTCFQRGSPAPIVGGCTGEHPIVENTRECEGIYVLTMMSS